MATATRCAELVGESVASCSYHLKILAKYGYIEPAAARGREKPWRLTSSRQDLAPHGRGPQAERASQQAVAAFLTHELERLIAHHRGRGRLPRRWRDAVGVGGSTVWVTPAELRQLRDDLLGILYRYADREEPSRPKGAKEARIFVSASVDPES